MANLFSAGDTSKVKNVLKRLMAVRIHRRRVTVGDISAEKANAALNDTGLTPEKADAIFALTSLAKFEERFVIPPAHRELAIEMLESAADVKGSAGFGFLEKPNRGV